MGTLEVLKPLCSTDPIREKLLAPFAVQWMGRRWAAASDGHMMALLPFDGEMRADGPDLDKLSKVLPERLPESRTVDVAALLAFAGPETKRDCRSCGGDGECECFECNVGHPCGFCAGTGEVRQIRYGRLFGSAVDLDYLRTVLSVAPAAQITVGQDAPDKPIVLHADGWLGLIMPVVRRDDKPSAALDAAPEFASVEPRAAPSSPLPPERGE